MMISPALAHGTSGGPDVGWVGPLILIGIAVAVVIFLIGEKKWRHRRSRRNADT
jgi:hypothetical protein